MNDKLHILQHSLGLNEYGEGRQYRNHFCTGPGSTDYDNCMALVGEGLMTRRAGSEISGGADIFSVTQTGIDYVTLNSPDKPKLTRGQQRYRNFLDADCGLSFAEYIRLNWRCP